MKLGIVIPWFGRDLKGGAEQQAWQIALRLSRRGHQVEVLTTCCRSHQDDWETNHLRAGRSIEPEGFAVRRFPVDSRNRVEFDRVCVELLGLESALLKPGVSPIAPHAAEIFARELIKSEGLQNYLTQHKTDYDWFLFLPYLYGPILDGIQAVADRAVLQPCLHDEAYAYLPQVAAAFQKARHLFFNSEGELELALRLFGPGIARKSCVVGEGVESAPGSHGIHSGNGTSFGEDGRYLLYLGRKDPGKNVPLLLRAFARFRAVRPNSKLGLVLAGLGDAGPNLPSRTTDAGTVTNEKKEYLLRHCVALVQPSRNESFSRVMMEAWLRGKPVAVHAQCPATAIPVKRSGAGWRADSEEEWAALFVELDRTSESELQRLGQNGQRYASVEADWPTVIDRYEAALAPPRFEDVPPAIATASKLHLAINQFLPNLSPGDAISNEAIFIRDQLREAGFKSDIYVFSIHPRLPPNECYEFTPAALEASDAIIYHHSIGTWITPHIANCSRPKCLIYHNITPAEFFEPYRPKFAELLRDGRRDLPHLATAFRLSYGDSAYNSEELAACGFTAPEVLPICVNPQKWSFQPDQEVMRSLSDGRTNILFVGRIAPNKKQDELVQVFARYRTLDPDARLFLVGTVEHQDPYADHLFREIKRLGLESSVYVANSISDAQLAAYYRTAHLFWSMSEHEGFLVPVIEAMWFDIPVFAFHSTAVPETLGPAAFTFNDKSDPDALAAAAYLLVTDPSLREQVITAQRRQRNCYLPERITPRLLRLVERLLNVESLSNHGQLA